MKVDLSYTEMNWIVSALNHKIAALEDELKRADPESAVGMLADVIYEILYLVCDMRYDLDRGAEIFPPAFLVKHVPVDFTGGEV